MTEPTTPPEHKKVSFDPTINLGHVLTFISLVIAGFAAWSALNTRVAVLEEARVQQSARDSSQDALIKERIAEVLAAVNRVDARVERAVSAPSKP